MTDITNFGSSFPGFGSESYQKFGGFRMKNLANKKRSDDTEQELANLLSDLENIESDRVIQNNSEKNKSKWWLVWRNPDELSPIGASTNGVVDDKKHIGVFKRVIAAISAGLAGLQTFTFANSAASSSTGMFFGIFSSVDSMLRAMGVAMAIGCGSLPFVVYAFQIGGQGGVGAPDSKPAAVGTFKPHDGWYKRSHFELVDHVDPYATRDYDSKKAIMSNGRGLPRSENPDKTDGSLKPSAPKSKPYVVKDVVNGMAMIEYDQGYWFARPGSKLPDGSYYVRVMKDNETGKVALKTSKGIIPVNQ